MALSIAKWRNYAVLLWIFSAFATFVAFSSDRELTLISFIVMASLSGLVVLLQLECAFHAKWKLLERVRQGELRVGER